jgi:FkbM family methyltransferase
MRLLQEGLWKESTNLTFAAGKESASAVVFGDDAGTETSAAIRDGAPGSTTIRATSLADLAARFKFNRLDFVKMDIEGAELEAVEGAISLLSPYKPRFSIASYHVRDGRRTADALEDMFKSAGYEAETGFSFHPTTYASPSTPR